MTFLDLKHIRAPKNLGLYAAAYFPMRLDGTIRMWNREQEKVTKMKKILLSYYVRHVSRKVRGFHSQTTCILYEFFSDQTFVKLYLISHFFCNL